MSPFLIGVQEDALQQALHAVNHGYGENYDATQRDPDRSGGVRRADQHHDIGKDEPAGDVIDRGAGNGHGPEAAVHHLAFLQLQERKMMHSRLGTVAIACAAVDDVTGWFILAYIVVLIRTAHSATSIWVTLGGIVVFAIAMIYGVQRLLQGIFLNAYQKWGHLSENRMAFMMLLVLASSLMTESLGIHLLFGAFLMGAIMPKEPVFVRYVLDRFETITVTLLLPLFFA